MGYLKDWFGKERTQEAVGGKLDLPKAWRLLMRYARAVKHVEISIGGARALVTAYRPTRLQGGEIHVIGRDAEVFFSFIKEKRNITGADFIPSGEMNPAVVFNLRPVSGVGGFIKFEFEASKTEMMQLLKSFDAEPQANKNMAFEGDEE